MIGFIQFNKPSIGYQGTLTLKPLTVKTRFVGIIDQPIRGKYDCEQSRFYSRIVRKMRVLHNPIESLNAIIKKKTKSKGSFPTQGSALKMVYLATQQIQEKWQRTRVRNWGEIYP